MKCTEAAIPEGHDWVLVPQDYADNLSAEAGKKHWTHILWACPCGQFKWTSYAKWEANSGQANERERDAIFGGGQP